MKGLKRPKIWVKAFVLTCAVFALSLGATRAADLTSQPAPPAPAPAPVLPDLSGWYVRVGAFGLLDRTSSNLYSQSIAGVTVPGIQFVPVAGVGPQLQLEGRGASYSNLYSVAFEGGYSFTTNWSVEVASGFPVWATVKINGYNPAGPASGTILGKLLPGGIPITGVYRFTQFGRFQPYLGAGIEPTFELAVRDGYSTGGSYQTALGLILQGGFDYMFDRHWGVFFDVKQGFVGTTGNSTGINLGPPLGIISVAGTIKTNARPVTFATGISYRF